MQCQIYYHSTRKTWNYFVSFMVIIQDSYFPYMSYHNEPQIMDHLPMDYSHQILHLYHIPLL